MLIVITVGDNKNIFRGKSIYWKFYFK